MQLFKGILEGCNQSGKSSIMAELERLFTECVSVTVHGYYHPAVVASYEGKLWEMVEYGRTKMESLLPVFEAAEHEEVLMLRLHLTDIVYLKLFHGIDTEHDELEEYLNSIGVCLIVLDVDDDELHRRMEERRILGKTGNWDKDLKSIFRKRDAYREAFASSRMKKKLLLNTTGKSAEQNAQAILEWFRTLG
ncbi:MAG: hypothetical protein PHN19_01785 [Patescibacteria group bacterium]|nr:hypothetical protein [Patescibacteria group bacterium]